MPEPLPPPLPRRHEPGNDPAQGEEAFAPGGEAAPVPGAHGVEYLVLGAALTLLVFALSARARKLLSLLYNPAIVALLVVIFAEYLILKARDRTFTLQREIELQRRKRRDLENSLDDCRRIIDELAPPGAGPDWRPGEKALARARRLRDDLDAIR